MKYLKIKWINDFINEPLYFYHEIGDDNYEIRRIEEYKNGDLAYIDDKSYSKNISNTFLSPANFSNVFEDCSPPEFEACEITNKEFEEIWQKAICKVGIR